MRKSINTKPRRAIKYAPWDEIRVSSRTVFWIFATGVKAMNFWEI